MRSASIRQNWALLTFYSVYSYFLVGRDVQRQTNSEFIIRCHGHE